MKRQRAGSIISITALAGSITALAGSITPFASDTDEYGKIWS